MALEIAAVGLVAGAFLLQGARPALGALAGGMAMAAGHALAATVSFAGGVQPARIAFARLLLGALGKWAVVVAVLAIALGAWRLPPLPVLAGGLAALLAYLLVLNLCGAKRQRD